MRWLAMGHERCKGKTLCVNVFIFNEMPSGLARYLVWACRATQRDLPLPVASAILFVLSHERVYHLIPLYSSKPYFPCLSFSILASNSSRLFGPLSFVPSQVKSFFGTATLSLMTSDQP